MKRQQTMEPPYIFHLGYAPLLVSIPHAGTFIPETLRARLTPAAQRVPDTDWHLEQLYDFAKALGASILLATHSRYVVDLNRPPDNQNLYPGQDTTGLCPVDTFDKEALYRNSSDVPEPQEVEQRKSSYWQPYHDQLLRELERLRSKFDQVVLWDAHSIRSVVPRFFDGRLPDMNLGTANGDSCASALANRLLSIGQASAYSTVLNGRFKGGYITRHYGQPSRGIHAVQLEMTQITYMNEAPPFAYRSDRAKDVKPCLKAFLFAALEHTGHRL
jgi:N-formylglutamate deformylase